MTLDIDDTVDIVHGHQQLSLFNAQITTRCFLPIHVYDTATNRPVAVLLRSGKTASGIEIRGHLRRLVRRLRRRWPQTRITLRGDGDYGRPEVWRGATRMASTSSLACAYRLMLTFQDMIPKGHVLATAEFATKNAGREVPGRHPSVGQSAGPARIPIFEALRLARGAPLQPEFAVSESPYSAKDTVQACGVPTPAAAQPEMLRAELFPLNKVWSDTR